MALDAAAGAVRAVFDCGKLFVPLTGFWTAVVSVVCVDVPNVASQLHVAQMIPVLPTDEI